MGWAFALCCLRARMQLDSIQTGSSRLAPGCSFGRGATQLFEASSRVRSRCCMLLACGACIGLDDTGEFVFQVKCSMRIMDLNMGGIFSDRVLFLV